MQEVVINGIILAKESFSSEDEKVKIFSQKLGLLKAYVRSGAKIKSKLSPHLEPVTLSKIRLFKKHRFTVTDALLRSRFKKIRRNSNKMGRALDITCILKSLLPQLAERRKLWNYLIKSFYTGELIVEVFLKELGYDPVSANCFNCKSKEVEIFFPEDQIFFCQKCSNKIPQKKKVKIK
ncbi:MAG: DNA repair protein RecO [Candidatus Magasanikbacteria bacterium]